MSRQLPYPLNRQSDGSYQFITVHSLIYTVYFVDGSAYIPYAPFSHDVLMVGFTCTKNVSKKPDARIAPTITQAIQSVFMANPNAILVYVCDASDGRQRIRLKLFTDWFSRAGTDYVHFTHQHVEPAFMHYAGMLMRSDNPWHNQAIELAQRFISEKFGEY